MHRSHVTAVTAVILAAALAGCADTGSSPSSSATSIPPTVPPRSTPTPFATPSGSPRAVAWAWQAPYGSPIALGPDGTVYATGPAPSCGVAIHALAADGAELAGGWPACAVGARYVSFLAVDGGGTVYMGTADRIVGLDSDGAPGVAWPAPAGGLVGTLREGVVVLAPGEGGSPELRAYGPDGRTLPGWPVSIPGTIVEPVLVGSDDSVAVLYRDMATGHRSVTRIERDGSTRRGWPAAVPDEMDGASVTLDLVTADGRVVLRAHEPWPVSDAIEAMGGLRAQVAVLAPDGTVPAGWPTRFDVPLSPLVEGVDGRILAVGGDVQYGPGPTLREPTGPYIVVSLEPDGTASPGWPARLPAGVAPQPAEVMPGPVVPWALPPVAGLDGSAVVLVRGAANEGLAWIDRDGALAMLYELPATLALSHGVPAAPGGPAKLPVIVGDRALLFVGIKRPAANTGALPAVDAPAAALPIPALFAGTSGGSRDGVLAIERAGAVAGWPVLLPPGTYAGPALVTRDDRLVVSGSTESESGSVMVVDATTTDPSR